MTATKKITRIIYPLLIAAVFLMGAYWRFHDLDAIKGYYFDEVYHVPTAKLIAVSDPRAYEWTHGELKDEIQTGTSIDWLHPPLAKLMQATSILFFGENEFGWRFASALMGTLLLPLVFLLTRVVCPDHKWAALLAMGLAAVDGLAIAQSRIAMNDIFVTFFMVSGVLAYLMFLREKRRRRWLVILALVCGCALASKWSGVFLLGFIGFWELATQRRRANWSWKSGMAFLVFLGTVSISIYLLSYFQLFANHGFKHFLELNKQITRYQTGLDATHPYSSRAWEWPLGLKPVYLHVDPETGQQVWNRPFYPTWFLAVAGVAGSVAAIFVVPVLQARRKKRLRKKAHPLQITQQSDDLLYITTAYFFFWVFWCFSPRLMFFHHYLPASALLWVITPLLLTVIRDYYMQLSTEKNAVIKKDATSKKPKKPKSRFVTQKRS